MDLWMLVLAMGLVTFLPRLIPMLLLNNLNLPPFWQSFFQFIPFAALGSLIFPGMLSSTGSLGSAVIGGLVSILLAALRLNIILVVLGGILGVFLWQLV
ncbi:MAG: AzlD domain-containing protein [Carboxydocellales bacterium]